jgi:tetratricopeptide (TPR) repeat protein/transcriptional regulator with XRE-family HTH domain
MHGDDDFATTLRRYRERLAPEDVGIAASLPRSRRVPGLRRDELAAVAGVSEEHLKRLEQGRRHPSQGVVDALAKALHLTRDEHDHLRTLAGYAVAAEGDRRAPRPASEAVCALPPAVPDLLGRARELDRLRAVAATGGVVAVVGQPGVGKTALAVWAAQQLSDAFPDGCFAVDLRGMDDQPEPARAALDKLLRALGVAQSQIPAAEDERANLFRLLVAGRRVLVLLDNAADEAQVRPLLARSPGSLTLVTCRRALAGLEIASWVWLDPLAETDAVGLLAHIAGRDRVEAEPAAAAELVALCGNLPLAVRIAGNRLATRPQWSLPHLVTQLRDERTRLSRLAAGDLQVRSAFNLSYRRLPAEATLVLRRLAAVPGADFGPDLAAVATGLDVRDVQPHLEELVDANLLQATPVPGRFQFHDLIRLFAGERREAEDAPEARDRLTDALLDHLLGAARTAGRVFFPEHTDMGTFKTRDEAAEWLARESANWIGAVREAARRGRHADVVAVAKAMHWYSDTRPFQRPWDELFGLGVASARALGCRADECLLLNFLGWAQYCCLGDFATALPTFEEAIAVATEIGDRREQTWAHAYLGTVLMRLGRAEEALGHARRACALSGAYDFWTTELSTRNRLAQILQALNRHTEALDVLQTVLADAEQRQDGAWPEMRRFMLAVVTEEVGRCLAGLGRWREAAAAYARARTAFHADLDLLPHEARTAALEGTVWRQAGEYARARECLEFALDAFAGPAAGTQREQVRAELALLPR